MAGVPLAKTFHRTSGGPVGGFGLVGDQPEALVGTCEQDSEARKGMGRQAPITDRKRNEAVEGKSASSVRAWNQR